ncbi:hypothetical protein PoB_003009000 [Plakobranchus ocellatus]|uniref:Uncharacterized protein n=1 Tax=Plakobranchus ocellatus TaxID=259542 RepID=A0AAV4A9X2_9GAST|nr:hypothetical protein PoB_003009000 [Plakobranchus ocellatus]
MAAGVVIEILTLMSNITDSTYNYKQQTYMPICTGIQTHAPDLSITGGGVVMLAYNHVGQQTSDTVKFPTTPAPISSDRNQTSDPRDSRTTRPDATEDHCPWYKIAWSWITWSRCEQRAKREEKQQDTDPRHDKIKSQAASVEEAISNSSSSSSNSSSSCTCMINATSTLTVGFRPFGVIDRDDTGAAVWLVAGQA